MVRSIFITHLHGDHCFGLSSVVALIDGAKAARLQDIDPERRRTYVYGPPGIAVRPCSCLHRPTWAEGVV